MPTTTGAKRVQGHKMQKMHKGMVAYTDILYRLKAVGSTVA